MFFFKREKIKKRIKSIIEKDIYNKKQVAEIHRIELEKWIEGEKLHRDPGNDYIFQWIEKHGSEFHTKFISSKCRFCFNVYFCKNVIEDNCNLFRHEINIEIIKGIIKLLIDERILKEEDEIIDLLKNNYNLSF